MATTPGPPILNTLPLAQNQTLKFQWRPPASDGGSPILGYLLRLNDADPGVMLGPSTRVYSTGPTLTNGQTYPAFLHASNAVGLGGPAYFRPFQPGLPPSPPSTITTNTITLTSGSSNSVLVSWTPPATTPAAQIFWYVLKVRPTDNSEAERAFTANGLSQSNYIVRGLTGDKTYQFQLQAQNCPGRSAPISISTSLSLFDYFVPNDIQGLNLWFDATDSTTLTLSGSNVTQWNDKSGYGLNTDNKFSIIALSNNSLNGCNALYFSNDAYFRGPLSYTGNQFTSFAVYRFLNVSDNRRILSLGSSNQPDYGNALYTYMGLSGTTITGGSLFGFYRNLTSLANMSTATSNINYLQTGGFSGSSNYASIYGNNPNFVASSGNFSFSNYGLGANVGLPSDGPTNKLMGEILLYRTDLPTFYRQQTEGYLAWKWGLQSNLPATHPYRSTRPLNPGLISPYSAPNLSFWLDATRISTISSGTALLQWNDVSSNNYVGTASNTTGNAANNPVYQSTVYNGYMPAVTFNGTTQYVNFGNTAGLMNTSSISVFAVSQTNAANGNIISKSIAGAGARWIMIHDSTSSGGTYFGVDPGTGLVQARQNSVTTGSPQLLNGNWNRQNVTLYRGGSLLATSALASSASVNSTFTLMVGAYNDGSGGANPPFPGYFLNGSIGEILVFMSTPIESTRQKIEGYLSWKWGLTTNLPGNHPYKFYPPLSNYSSIAINTSTIFATNFNAGNDIGFVNFSNTDLISSQTITGTGAAYNTLQPAGVVSRYPRINFTSITTNRATWTASVYLTTNAILKGIVLQASNALILGQNTNALSYVWNGVYNEGAFGTIPLNTWTHVALTISPTEARFYINGSNISTNTTTHSSASMSNMTIGTNPANSTDWFPGYIDNVRFYASTLTSNEVQAIYYNTQFI